MGMVEVNEQLVSLPEELIGEFLSRLPVRTLLKFRVVSKSWRSLIDSKQFIKSHLKNTKKYTVFVHSMALWNDGVESHSQYSFSDGDRSDFFYLRNMPKLRIVGSCNGLVCIVTAYRNLYFWNPSTGITWKLPDVDPDNLYTEASNLGFGWEESSDEYKVFAIMPDSTSYYRVKSRVYSSKTNSWKTLPSQREELYLCPNTSQLVNGKFHWNHSDRDNLNKNIHRIASFDLKTEMFGMIEAPSNFHDPFFNLGVLGGCLCIPSTMICSGVAVVWVMKEYGVRESWVPEIVLSQPLVPRPLFTEVYATWDGEILQISSSRSSFYDLHYEEDHFYDLPYEEHHFYDACFRTKSLVSPIMGED